MPPQKVTLSLSAFNYNPNDSIISSVSTFAFKQVGRADFI